MTMKASGIPLGIESIRTLSAIHPFRGMMAVAFRWLFIAAAAALVFFWPSIWSYLLAVLLVGTSMYAMYSLTHEGLHYHLHPDKRVNDAICKVFLSWPLGLDIRQMRHDHLQHHKHQGTENDPEWQHLQYDEFRFPLSLKRFVLISFLDLTGWNYFRYKLQRYAHAPIHSFKKDWKYLLLFSMLVLLSIRTDTLNVFFFCWFFPYISLYQWLNRVRLYTEHFNLLSETADTRSLVLPAWQQFFIAPHGLGYHKAHHLYPAVPFYNLHRLHQMLQDHETYRLKNVQEPSYFHLLKTISQHDAQ